MLHRGGPSGCRLHQGHHEVVLDLGPEPADANRADDPGCTGTILGTIDPGQSQHDGNVTEGAGTSHLRACRECLGHVLLAAAGKLIA